jgi:hypothetical protein
MCKPTKPEKTVLEVMKERDGLLPVWIRAPKSGPEHYCGLSRAKLYELTAAGRIRSISLKEPGQSKGCRLFHLESILTYLESFEEVDDEN